MKAASRRRALVFSWTGGAAFLAALAAANFLAYFIFLRADFSANRAYSISPGTKNLLRGLQDTLTVKVYYTPGLPPPYGLNRQYLRDILAEYKSAGRGRVKVEFQNPDDPKRRREAMEAGIAPLQLSVMGRDKFEIKESLMGLICLYKGKAEVLPVVSDTANLEYDITRRVKKLAAQKSMTVGFVSGHGEAAPGNEAYAPIFQQINEQLSAQTVSLERPVPAGVEALWIWAPTAKFKPAELERLKAWINSGRSLGLLLDRREVDYRSFFARPIVTGLEPLLSQWGLDVQDKFVVDAQAEKIQVESAYGFFRAISVVDYPYIPVATNMDRNHAAVRSLDAVSLPFAHPIRFETRPGLAYASLIDSSQASWSRGDSSVRPGVPLEQLAGKDKGPFSLAGVLSGDFFRVAPTTWTAAEDSAPATAPKPGRVIVVGTSRFAQPNFAGKQANLALLMNLLEWSLQDETLLSIRSKGVTFRPLRPLPGAAVLLVKYALIFCLPLGLVAAGLWLRLRHQAARRELARTFDES